MMIMMKKETQMDRAEKLKQLMLQLEKVADELEDMGYLDSSRVLDEVICELDFEMCAASEGL
jgi:hypothetical protein